MAKEGTGGELAIMKRYCKRYVPCAMSPSLAEFIKDRYRNVARPEGPFCHCGLHREEHKEEAIANAPPDVHDREKRIAEESPNRIDRRNRLKRGAVASSFDRRGTPHTQTHTQTHEGEWRVESDTATAPTDVHYTCCVGVPGDHLSHNTDMGEHSCFGELEHSSQADKGRSSKVLISDSLFSFL